MAVGVCDEHQWPYGADIDPDCRPVCGWCEALRADALERKLIDLKHQKDDELNHVKEVMFKHEPPSMERVHEVVRRICEDKDALRYVCQNEVEVIRSLLKRGGGSEWARALTLLMPDLRAIIGRLLYVLKVTKHENLEPDNTPPETP